MKQFKYILAIAVLAIFTVGCTDENELYNGVKSNDPIKQKTSVGSSRKHSEYEPTDKYNDKELQKMVNTFNNILNTQGALMPDYSIADAVIMLETHFNYGVVYKLPYNQDAEEYFEQLNFEFTVPIYANKVKGESLKPLYFEFVEDIIRRMPNKNLEFSDIYVKDINETTVTFGLEMNPSFKLPFYPNNFMFGIRKFKERGEAINIPSSRYSTWSDWASGAPEKVVQSFSYNRLIPNEYIYTTIVPGYGFNIFSHQTENAGDLVHWNNIDLQNITAMAVVAAQNSLLYSGYGSQGWTVFSYSPQVDNEAISLVVNGSTHLVDKYTLGTDYIKYGRLLKCNVSNLFMSNISDKLNIRD